MKYGRIEALARAARSGSDRAYCQPLVILYWSRTIRPKALVRLARSGSDGAQHQPFSYQVLVSHYQALRLMSALSAMTA